MLNSFSCGQSLARGKGMDLRGCGHVGRGQVSSSYFPLFSPKCF